MFSTIFFWNYIPFWPKTLFSISKTGRAILFLFIVHSNPHIFFWHCETITCLLKIAFFQTFNLTWKCKILMGPCLFLLTFQEVKSQIPARVSPTSKGKVQNVFKKFIKRFKNFKKSIILLRKLFPKRHIIQLDVKVVSSGWRVKWTSGLLAKSSLVIYLAG